MATVNEKERTELIRKGNQAFNEGKIELASKIFKTTSYQAGLIRIGDYYYFDKQQPLMAYGYYTQAKHAPMIEKIKDGFSFALKCWLKDEKPASQELLKAEDLPSAGVDLLKLIKEKKFE